MAQMRSLVAVCQPLLDDLEISDEEDEATKRFLEQELGIDPADWGDP